MRLQRHFKRRNSHRKKNKNRRQYWTPHFLLKTSLVCEEAEYQVSKTFLVIIWSSKLAIKDFLSIILTILKTTSKEKNFNYIFLL